MSQLYPNTTEQEESRGVTKQVMVRVSLVGKHKGKSTEAEIHDVEEPLKSRSRIGGIGVVRRSYSLAKLLSTKQCVDLESINVWKGSEDCMRGEESRRVRESGLERADVSSLRSLFKVPDIPQNILEPFDKSLNPSKHL